VVINKLVCIGVIIRTGNTKYVQDVVPDSFAELAIIMVSIIYVAIIELR